MVKAIKEKDAKNKEYNTKYLTMTEVPEEMVTSGALLDNDTQN